MNSVNIYKHIHNGFWQQVWLDLSRYTRQTLLASREAKNRVQDLRARFQVQIQQVSSLPCRDVSK